MPKNMKRPDFMKMQPINGNSEGSPFSAVDIYFAISNRAKETRDVAVKRASSSWDSNAGSRYRMSRATMKEVSSARVKPIVVSSWGRILDASVNGDTKKTTKAKSMTESPISACLQILKRGGLR